MKEQNRSFVNAAVIFGMAGIIVKIIGAFYKVPLGSILGTEGSSYVAFVYPYYNWLLVVSSAGFPAAIAKIVSEYNAKGDHVGSETVFVLMKRVMMWIGLVTMTILFLLAPTLTRTFGNPNAVFSMQAIAIALFFVSYMSAYRGYFQGHHNLMPFGVSQIIEQIGRVSTGIILAIVLMPIGVKYAAAGATFAASFGAILGTILLSVWYGKHRKKHNLPIVKIGKIRDHKALIKRIISLAIPITIGASVMPLVNMIDGFIIINRLQDIGYGETARAFYSYHAFYAASMVNFPQILFTAIQVSLLPAMSHLMAINDHLGMQNTVKTGMKVALLIGVPSAIGMSVLSGPIISLLWPNLSDVVAFTPQVLQVVSLSLIALSLFQATTGMLQGIGKQHHPAKNLLIGAAVKVVACYVLVGMPQINILGAGLSTILAFLIAVTLNVMVLFRTIRPQINLSHIILKPIFAAVVMGILVKLTYVLIFGAFGNAIATLGSVVAGVFVYGLMLVLLKALDQDDLAFLPGKRILKKLVR